MPIDRETHRSWLASLTDLPPGGTAVDLGCGRGEDLAQLAAASPQARAFLGLDASPDAVATARSAVRDPRVAVGVCRLDERIPLEDASVDLVFSHNLLECFADPRRFADEVARVLRPGGQVVMAHWDWDTQVFGGSDKVRVRRLVNAYADWQQAWMTQADGWMGRRLWGVFNPLRAFLGTMHARVLTNTVFAPPQFGYENAMAFRALVRRGLATAEDCEQFIMEQAELSERGEYFYSLTGYAYVGQRTGS